MPYCLYKLRFRALVHFGADQTGIGVESVQPICRADTFFSAYCHGLLALRGKLYLEEWLEAYQQKPAWTLSDLMPFHGQDLYWPRPLLPPVQREAADATTESSAAKKRWKKCRFIPLRNWKDYLAGSEMPEAPQEPWQEVMQARVGVSYPQFSDPYQLGAIRFAEGAGLALLVHFTPEADTDEFENVLDWLALEGIGGERSTGCGQFEVEDCSEPAEADSLFSESLQNLDNQPVMSLTTFSPDPTALTQEILQNSAYDLIPRRGFVSSPDARQAIRRRSLYFMGAGSVFPQPISGHLADVTPRDFPHKVWRYGHPIWVRLKP